MGGIEPPSTAEEPRLLRAQSACVVLLGPDPYRRRIAIDGPSPGLSPTAPRGGTSVASLLADAGYRGEGVTRADGVTLA